MNDLLQKVLLAQVRAGRPVEIPVVGVSMNPSLSESVLLTVAAQTDYTPGDILVYSYKQEGLLVHRLLYRNGDRYFCKGDNAFRMEDITTEQIVGRVIAINGREPPPCPPKLLLLSHLVNRAFFRCRYEVEKTKQTSIYRLYEKTILKKEDDTMIYKKNESIDYIQSDDTSLAAFDPESGDTHFFDETGVDILNSLSEPCDLDGLLDKLCILYDVSPEDIRADVEEFLRDTVEKKVVEIL